LLAIVIADVSPIAGTKQKTRLTVLAQKSDVSAVIAPDDVLDRRRRELRKGLLLLNVEQDNGGWRRQQERRRATVEDLIGLDRTFDRFGEVVGQVADLNVLIVSFVFMTPTVYSLGQSCRERQDGYAQRISRRTQPLAYRQPGRPCHRQRTAQCSWAA